MPNGPLTDDDQSFLDLAFEFLLRCLETGTAPDAERLLAGRAHLRAQVMELLAMARDIVVLAPGEREMPGDQDA
jgi:hypothetical protein